MSTPIPPAVPSASAYFGVRVPQNGRVTEAEARQVVERYLYGGFAVLDVVADYSDGFDSVFYMVTVRVEVFGRPATGVEEVTNRVRTQRDRLASGMYSTTETTILAPVEA